MKCSKLKDQLVEVANGYATQATASLVEQHAQSCLNCKHELEQLQALILTPASAPDPGVEFWDGYFEKLEARMASESELAKVAPLTVRPLRDRIARLRLLPMWSLQAAAAVVILITGIWLGRGVFADPSLTAVATAAPTELENQALSYLDRTKTVLLGLANFDPLEDDPADLNMERRKSLAGGLIQEASFLKKELSRSDQARLSELIGDLEVILLQIANLETEYDIPEIEMVKNGVDRKAIFFKIDVENMLRTSGAHQRETPSNRPSHSAI